MGNNTLNNLNQQRMQLDVQLVAFIEHRACDEKVADKFKLLCAGMGWKTVAEMQENLAAIIPELKKAEAEKCH
jgi:hypothetical protein